MDINRKEIETTLTEQFAVQMELPLYALWQQCNVAHRVSVHEGCVLVVWRKTADGSADPLEAFEVTKAALDCRYGLSVQLSTHRESRWVQHHPQQLKEYPLFLWTPFCSDIRYEPHPKYSGMVLRLPLAMRMKHHPDYAQAGDILITPVSNFKTRFPQFADTKF